MVWNINKIIKKSNIIKIKIGLARGWENFQIKRNFIFNIKIILGSILDGIFINNKKLQLLVWFK